MRAAYAAVRFMRHVLRFAPGSPETYYWLAGVLWQQHHFAGALPLNRVAACLGDKDERYAQAYFATARYLKATDKVLTFLRSRVQRFSLRSGQPVMTLFWALEELNRTEEAFAVLEQRCSSERTITSSSCLRPTRTPGTGSWTPQCNCSRWSGRWHTVAAGSGPRRTSLCIPVSEHRHSSTRARYWSRSRKHSTPSRPSCNCWSTWRACRPPRGISQARSTQWPHNYRLQQMFVYHLRHEDLQAARIAAHQLLEYSPADAWTYRELANIDTQLGRLDDALAEAEQARQLQPNSPESYCLLGYVHATSGRRDEARQACREALRRSVDNEYAMGLLMACCESAESQREALRSWRRNWRYKSSWVTDCWRFVVMPTACWIP